MNGLGRYEERTPVGYEQITALSTIKTTAPPVGARMAIISCTGQAVRWTDDDTITPSATIGMNMAVDAPFVYTGNVGALRFIEVAVGGIVDISYYN